MKEEQQSTNHIANSTEIKIYNFEHLRVIVSCDNEEES
jgi:hypothetical protein